LEAAAVQLGQERQAEAEAKLATERAAWAEQARQIEEAMRKKLEEVEADRKRERESASNMQRFQASQIRDLQGSATQANLERTAPAPDSTTTSRGGDPERATSRTGVSTGNATSVQTAMGQKNFSEAALAQLRATIPGATLSWLPQSSPSQAVKTEASADAPQPKPTKPQASQTT
jgi:hypothetical protein